MIVKNLGIVLLCTCLLFGCQRDVVPLADSSARTTPSPSAAHSGGAGPARLFGIAVGPSSQSFDLAVSDAVEAGSQVFEIPQQWKDVEDPTNLQILTQLCDLLTQHRLRAVLTMNPLDTMENQIPQEFQEYSFDDPVFVKAYTSFVDTTLARVSQVELVSIAIGNEVDILLSDSKSDWESYTRFFIEIKRHIHKVKPGVPVGVKITFDGFRSRRALVNELVSHSDLVMLTYYPIAGDSVRSPAEVKQDFAEVCEAYPGLKVQFNEIGYPSSSAVESSEESQAQFVVEALHAWESHPQIQLLNFVWINEMTPEAVEGLEAVVGEETPLVAFLSSLGLRDSHGTPKLAFRRLVEERKRLDF